MRPQLATLTDLDFKIIFQCKNIPLYSSIWPCDGFDNKEYKNLWLKVS